MWQRLAWLTDIHLNFLHPLRARAFLASLADTEADAFLIGGDIGEATDISQHLNALAHRLQRPIFFTLGNHDFYRGSIAAPGSQSAISARTHPTSTGCRMPVMP